uniref:C-type lectin domain-containing protein n=1 Tax=Poecilia reticulata TaxID=8081 RepID=A0A3P9Q9U3_POERE
MPLTLLAGQHEPKLFSSKTFILRDSERFMPFCTKGLCCPSLAASQLKYIYFLFLATKEGTDQYVMVDEVMGWSDALEYCRTLYTDLTSVRNDAELDIIQSLAVNASVWVGLFRDSWVWSDGADSSFRNWLPGTSVWSDAADSCGALLKNQSSRWGEQDCTETNVTKPFIFPRDNVPLKFQLSPVRITI